MLYSCADNYVMMHDYRVNQSPSVNIDEVITQTNSLSRSQVKRSEIAFHPENGKVLAIGCDDGTVEISSLPHLDILVTVKTFNKLIQVCYKNNTVLRNF